MLIFGTGAGICLLLGWLLHLVKQRVEHLPRAVRSLESAMIGIGLSFIPATITGLFLALMPKISDLTAGFLGFFGVVAMFAVLGAIKGYVQYKSWL